MSSKKHTSTFRPLIVTGLLVVLGCTPETDAPPTTATPAEPAVSALSVEPTVNTEGRSDARARRRSRLADRHSGSLERRAMGPSVRIRRFERDGVHTVQINSDVFHIDRLYKSMEGPSRFYDFPLLVTDRSELVWVTGYRATMMGADGTSVESQEFMCHSNLNIWDDQYEADFGTMRHTTKRMFTLSQGQFDIDFPQGFAIPMMSDQTVQLGAQVLNHNVADRELDVRHRVSIEFVRDRDLAVPMKPLFTAFGEGLVALDDDARHYSVDNPSPDQHGEGCLVGKPAVEGKHFYPDAAGRRFAGHWVVKPGREENRTLVTELMQIPFDTTLHYIAVHLHPFAESLELRDLTTGETLFKSRVENRADAIGILRIDHYSSTVGIPVYAEHEYEMVSVYNNTSGIDQDSMAVMYFYLLDEEFEKPVGS